MGRYLSQFKGCVVFGQVEGSKVPTGGLVFNLALLLWFLGPFLLIFLPGSGVVDPSLGSLGARWQAAAFRLERLSKILL